MEVTIKLGEEMSQELFEAAQTLAAKEPEHWTNWLARKCHKTHFQSSKNASQVLPKTTNTARLIEYSDGLGEALETLRSAQTRIFDESATEDGLVAMNALGDAINYLKGKDLVIPRLFTRSLCPEDECDCAKGTFCINHGEPKEFQDSVEKNKELLEKLSDEPPTTA
jgi:hypothetical protein